MIKMSHLGVLVFYVLTTQATGDSLPNLPTHVLKREVRSLIDDGNEVMKNLEKKIDERQMVLKTDSSKNTWLGINFVDCSNLGVQLATGQSLLIAGGSLSHDITSQFNQITDCFSSMTKYQCWAQIVKELPVFLATFKPLTSCYVNNVYYTMEMIDYYFDSCIGSTPSSQPHQPPKTFKECMDQ